MTDRMSRRRRASAPDSEAPAEAGAHKLHFLPFTTIPLGRKGEIEVNLVDGPDRQSVSMRLWSSQGEGRPTKSGRPIHLFAEQLPDLIATLTGAAAAIGALPDDWPTPPPHGTRRRPTKDTMP